MKQRNPDNDLLGAQKTDTTRELTADDASRDGAETGSAGNGASAFGADGNTGAPVAVTALASATLTVVPRASLQVSALAFAPAGTVSTGQSFTVLMTVDNPGQGAAAAVTPSALTAFGTASASLASAPVPVASLANGSSTTFTYVYTAGAAGTLGFSGTVNGFDANQGVQLPTAPLAATSPTAR